MDRDRFREHPARSETPVPEENTAVRKIGLSVLKGAAVGVACGAVPTACPAILAMSRAADLATIVSDVYRAYESGMTREKGIVRAADKAGQAAVAFYISETIRTGSEAEMRQISRAVGTAVDAGASIAFSTEPGAIRALAEETTYRAMEEGVDGVVSWTIEELRRSE